MHKGKVTADPRTGHVGPEGELKDSFNISLTSVPGRGGLITPYPGRFTPGKESRYRLYRRLCVPQGRSGRAQKISAQQGFDLRIVRRVARCYPDTYMVMISRGIRRKGNHEWSGKDLKGGDCRLPGVIEIRLKWLKWTMKSLLVWAANSITRCQIEHKGLLHSNRLGTMCNGCVDNVAITVRTRTL
jgi:hypothetical protein